MIYCIWFISISKLGNFSDRGLLILQEVVGNLNACCISLREVEILPKRNQTERKYKVMMIYCLIINYANIYLKLKDDTESIKVLEIAA